MFDGYWRADTPAFRGDWYLTGDTMRQDEDGHFFFVGRNDDIITSAGYRIGPFDVESVMIEHPAVAEVAVVGKPDPERTEIVKAFVVLRAGIRGERGARRRVAGSCPASPFAARLSARDRLRARIAQDAERKGPALPAAAARMTALSHIDAAGQARMVDVSGKDDSARTAVAEGRVVMAAATLALILSGDAKKGDVLGAARIAGIMAAKRTHELIPLCHPLLLTKVAVEIAPDPDLPGLRLRAEVKTRGQTGVEMEALTAVSIACLTIYDMAKAVDRGMQVEGLRLLEKSGGKSGDWRRAEAS